MFKYLKSMETLKTSYLKIRQAHMYKYLILLKYMIEYNPCLKYSYKRIKQFSNSFFEFNLR